MILGSQQDAEDALQETMMRYYTKRPETTTTDENYRKAWLIRVASNICRDICRKRHEYLNFEDCLNVGTTDEITDVLHSIMQLPDIYKIPLILFHVEGYKAEEIAKILNVPSSTIRKRLQKGRIKLKLEYGKE